MTAPDAYDFIVKYIPDYQTYLKNSIIKVGVLERYITGRSVAYSYAMALKNKGETDVSIIETLKSFNVDEQTARIILARPLTQDEKMRGL